MRSSTYLLSSTPPRLPCSDSQNVLLPALSTGLRVDDRHAGLEQIEGDITTAAPFRRALQRNGVR